MNKEPVIERKLTAVEESMLMLDKLRPFNGVIHVAIEGTLTEEALRMALDATQARHPLLRVRIANDGKGGYRFESESVPEIPLRISEGPEEGWADEAEIELHTKFPTEKGPFARAALVRHGKDKLTLLLSQHHVIVDATAALYLLRDVINAVALAQGGKEVSMPALGPKQAMVTYLPSWAKGIRGAFGFTIMLLRFLIEMFRWGMPVMPRLDRWVPLPDRKARLVSCELDPLMVEGLIARARQEKTTVYGALAAAFIMALAIDLERSDPVTFMMGSAIDMRERLRPPIGDDIGLFVTACVSIIRGCSQSNFWQLAREIRGKLIRSIDRGEPFLGWMAFSSITSFRRSLGFSGTGVSNIGEVKFGSRIVGLSNLGVLDIPCHFGNCTIKKVGFATSGSALGTLLSAAATIEGRMVWDFVGMEPLFEKEHTERVAETAIGILKKNLNSS